MAILDHERFETKGHRVIVVAGVKGVAMPHKKGTPWTIENSYANRTLNMKVIYDGEDMADEGHIERKLEKQGAG